MSVKARIFAGILINSEVRMHLNSSHLWKNALIEAAHSSEDFCSDDLVEIKHHTRDYVGFYLIEEKVKLSMLAAKEAAIKEKLISYCPRLLPSSLQFYVFSQLLVF